eukprot:comp24232_c2_seq9/m.44695 comp24232_c2_seq9/g.44695  ORF comp24232_c2_seq9/g.44695 comp24232_c2_seq9/m.44695 type:complete len:317 (-) comp24232_c2_seq9:297-1247(-)
MVDFSVPSDLTSRRFLRALVAEFVGMMFFLLITIGTVVSSTVLMPGYQTMYSNANTNSQAPSFFRVSEADKYVYAFTFGISIAVLVYNTGPTSGGHLNPAVTCALVTFGKHNFFKGILFIISQFLGATVGTALVKGLYPDQRHGNFALNALAGDVSTAQGFFLEVFGTAILTYTVFAMAVDPKANEPHGRAPYMAPLAIGFSVLLAHLVLIPVTNCGINPARSFGPALITGDWTNYWIFFFGPMLGGPLGAAFHYVPARFLVDEEESAVADIKDTGANTAMKVQTVAEDGEGQAPDEEMGKMIKHHGAERGSSVDV